MKFVLFFVKRMEKKFEFTSIGKEAQKERKILEDKKRRLEEEVSNLEKLTNKQNKAR